MRNETDIKREAAKLLAEAEALTQQKKLKRISDNLNTRIATAEKEEHARKAAPYLAFMESKQYIDSLADDIANTGSKAINTVTGTETQVKLSPDRNSLRTFAKLTAGSTHNIGGSTVIIKSVDSRLDGSTADIIYLSSKFQLAESPVTPYSSIPCRWNSYTKELICATQHRLHKPNR